MFWTIVAISYLILAAANYFFNKRIDIKYLKAKQKFKKDYGFQTFGVFEIVSSYTNLSTKINIIGFILAGLAAFLSL